MWQNAIALTHGRSEKFPWNAELSVLKYVYKGKRGLSKSPLTKGANEMKLRRLTAAALAAALCLGGPAAYAAGSADAELARVTQTVKSTLSVPDGYTKFYGEPQQTHLGTFWELNWSGEDGELSVSATNEGKVLSMYQNASVVSVPGSSQNSPHFPALDRAQAQRKAQAFLNKVLTAGEKAVFSENSSVPSLSGQYRTFRGTIELNGLPSPLSFSVRVRLSDGEVAGFNRDDVSGYAGSLPAAKTAVSQKDAAAKLKTVLALRLEYVKDKDKAVLRYLPESRHEYYVDAASGALVDLTELREKLAEYGGDGAANRFEFETTSAAPEAAADAGGLTKEELEGVAKLEGVLTAGELDQKARAWTELGLNGFERSAASFAVDREDGTVTVQLGYAKKTGDGTARRYVTLDAKTGALLSVHGYRPYAENARATLTESSAQAKAEAFLKALWPEQFAKTELYGDGPAAERDGLEYSFQFARKVNGYFFPENSLTVRVDGVDGTILGLSRTFDEEIAFDSPDGIISMDAAVTAWAGSYPMELAYVEVPVRLDLLGGEAKPLMDAGFSYFNALKPGYGLDWGEDGFSGVDAKTGALTAWERWTQDEMTYSDLSGHWAEAALKELAEYRVGWLGGRARPDAPLTQADLIALMASTDGRFFDSEEGGADELYRYAYSRGLLTRDQRDDGRQVTRMELVKLLLDSFGLKTAANLQGIYRCDFTDAGELGGNLGYAALAQGLGMAGGDSAGRFAPNRGASRAEAAVMLWNYMKR